MIFPDPKPEKPVRLKGQDKTEFRAAVCKRANSTCQKCGWYAPLLIDGVFKLWSCGHVHHVKSKGSGGGDIATNAIWLCADCHYKLHGLRWSKVK